MAKEMKCVCGPSNFGWMILSALVCGVGLWLLVGGLMMQWSGGAMWWQVGLWYAAGALVMSISCCLKKKACSGCPAHS